MEKERFIYLFQRCYDQTATAQERDEFLELSLRPEYEETVNALLADTFSTAEYSDDPDEQTSHNILAAIFDAREKPVTTHRTHFLRRSFFRYAAAILLITCLGAAAYLWTNNNKNKQPIANIDKPLAAQIPPGGEKAVLTLADGSKITLDNIANGKLATQGGVQVIKLSNGSITYDLHGSASKEIMLNTMTTPKGGQYQVILPDGTKAWLNAASSITFPAAFAGTERRVKTDGEIYFEVARDNKKPFIVDVGGKENIQVLGTSFNVNSYKDEENIKTTLVEGSVKISNNKGQATLQPGQQAVINNTAQLIVNANADINQTLAWKNGLFSFDNSDLRSVMRQLERWYDIKVKYEGQISDITLIGKMYRNVNLSDVLEFLRTMGVNTRMEGKTLIVF